MFINREAELAHLERLYRSERAELFVLYGRRRVGKTGMLRAFCADKPHLFFIATLSSDRDQLAAFSQQIWQFDHPEAPEGFTFPSWEAAFRALADLPSDRGRPVVILDEFTYLISGNKALPSILQKVWDETLQHSRLFLVLCGSYVGMMEKEVLGYQAPLYGRRTGSYLLPPLDLPAAAAFFPAYSPIQQIEAWAVLGGMPYYLQTFSDAQGLWANIQSQILDVTGPLYNEPHLLLMEELREPRNYFSILRAIAQGRTRLNEIAQAAGVGDARTTSRYLDILRQMRLVRRIVPASESRPEKSKKGLYRLADPFLRFWFRFVHPYRGSLELGLAPAILKQRVQPAFDQFMGYAFEEAAQGHIAQLARRGELDFLPERIGHWWDRQNEIDVMAVSDSEGAVLLGECKWSARPVGGNILAELERKAALLQATGRWPRVTYALFAKQGFTDALRAHAARREGEILLFSAADLIGHLANQPFPWYD
ncbi:MAG TPA: ATP-binding protein [Anaerolineae bacterium]|nr:ATP-binding protein [Anaerolineae bacterium]